MGKSIWTVKPEEVKVDLVYVTKIDVPRQDDPTKTESVEDRHAFWIKLKKRLTVGESRKAMMSGWRSASFGRADGQTGTEVQIDWQRNSFARTEAYLLDWSLEDEDGKRLDARSRDVIEALDPDVYALIEDAITALVEATDGEKKILSGRK